MGVARGQGLLSGLGPRWAFALRQDDSSSIPRACRLNKVVVDSLLGQGDRNSALRSHASALIPMKKKPSMPSAPTC